MRLEREGGTGARRLPEPQCWQRATWLSSLNKEFLSAQL